MANTAIMALIGLPVMLLSILLPVALVIALQVWLCKRQTRWLGLILPGLSFLFSLLLVFSFASFGLMTSGVSGGAILEENGQVVQQSVTEHGVTTIYDGEGNIIDQYPAPDPQPDRSALEVAAPVAAVFLIGNIPTVVLGGIWLHYKNRRDFQEDLKKMKIEDLG